MTVILFHESHRSLARDRYRIVWRVLANTADGVLAMLREWRRRAHDRAELAKLDDRMLRDIGLTRADAEFLGNKPFWRG